MENKKPANILEVVRRYGVENLVLNSDTGFPPSDIITVPRTVNLLSSILSREKNEKIAWNNSIETFKLS